MSLYNIRGLVSFNSVKVLAWNFGPLESQKALLLDMTDASLVDTSASISPQDVFVKFSYLGMQVCVAASVSGS